MEQENRQVRCLACDATYPLATGVCPSCGAEALAPTSAQSYTVWVHDIPSSRHREEIANLLCEMFDCADDAATVAQNLADGPVALCTDLSREAAQILVESLQRRHVAARLEAGRPETGGGAPVWLWIPGYVPLVAGVGVDLAAGLLPWLTITGAGLTAAAFGVRAAMRKKRGRPPIGVPYVAATRLPGWDAAASPLARLLRSLDGEPRDALSTVATEVAALQSDIASGSLAAFAAGGQAGGLAQSAQKILAAALEEAQRIAAAGGQAEEPMAKLSSLVAIARQARERFARLASEGSGEAQAPAENDVAELAAAVEQELERAAEGLESVGE